MSPFKLLWPILINFEKEILFIKQLKFTALPSYQSKILVAPAFTLWRFWTWTAAINSFNRSYRKLFARKIMFSVYLQKCGNVLTYMREKQFRCWQKLHLISHLFLAFPVIILCGLRNIAPLRKAYVQQTTLGLHASVTSS